MNNNFLKKLYQKKLKESHLSLLCFTCDKALLFGAWVCILKYFDMHVIRQDVAAFSSGTSSSTLDLSKEEFFRGITIFAWVMVILLALILIFSFDKICSRSSPWTLTVSDHDYLPLPQSQLLTRP